MDLYQAPRNDWSQLSAPPSDYSHLMTDPLSAGSSSWASQAQGQYGYDPFYKSNNLGSYDPAYSSNVMYDPISGFTARGIAKDIEDWMQDEIRNPQYQYLYNFKTGKVNTGFGGSAGDVSQNPSFGQFAQDPAVFNEIAAAAKKYGVPANLLKAMIGRESSGIWGWNAEAGVDTRQATYLPSRGQRIVGYTGIVENTATSWGVSFDQLIGNRALQIDTMAKGLKILHDQVGGQHGWDGVIATYYSGDPTAASTPADSVQYGSTQQYVRDVKEWWSQEDAWTKANGGQAYSEGNSGLSSPQNAAWAPVNRWDNYVSTAASKYQVPANLIKAMMQLESGGDPRAGSPAGATGLMQVMPGMHGLSREQLLDPARNVDKGAQIIRNNFDRWGSWEAAAKAYLAGTPHSTARDAMGSSVDTYWRTVQKNWDELNAAQSGVFGGNPSENPGPMYAIEATWGGTRGDIGHITQEHGPGAFSNSPEWSWMYDYSIPLLGGVRGHPGIDVGMPVGTQLFTPVAGTVTIAGPEQGFEHTGGGAQTGQLRLRLDNGHELIFGHMAGIHVRVGDRLTPGQAIGVSGTYGTGAHLHYEYRVPTNDPRYPEGWMAMDPREALGGVLYTGGLSGTTAQAGVTRPFTYAEIQERAARGLPVDYGMTTGDTSSWNSWLLGAMRGEIPNSRNASSGDTGYRTPTTSLRDPRSAGAAYNPWGVYSMGRM